VRGGLKRLVPDDAEVRDLVSLFGFAEVVAAIDDLLSDPDRAGWELALRQTPAVVTADWLGANRSQLRVKWLDHLRTADNALARVAAALAAAAPIGANAVTVVN